MDSCHHLRIYRSRRGDTLQCTILEAALASISTIGLFEPVEITTGRRKYTGAGIRYANPIMELVEEAEKIYGGEQRISCLLSLGTGISASPKKPADLSWLDVHGMLQAMGIQQGQTATTSQRQFGNLQAYFRFSIDSVVDSTSLYDWTHWESDQIDATVREYLKRPHQSSEFDAAIGSLLDRKGTVTLSRLSKY